LGGNLFTERLSEEKLKLLYHICNVNLYPVENQTYSLVPFEALAAGKPSLISADSGAGLTRRLDSKLRDSHPRPKMFN
jgi:glycosyltransferase involved in cell wall biosynthesis